MEKHTETPWGLVEFIERRKKVFHKVHDQNGLTIAELPNALISSPHHDRQRNNARFIVRACNSHAALLAACKSALAELEGIMPQWEPNDHTHSAWETIEELQSAIKAGEA